MTRSTLRIVIIILTLITALIHLALGLGGVFGGNADMLAFAFVANGLGYLALLAALFMNVPYFSDHRDQAHYLMMAFAALTFVLYFVFNGLTFGIAAIIAKSAELLLIIATFMHLRAA